MQESGIRKSTGQMNLAWDADNHLTYLALNEWRLGFIMEAWPEIEFRKTREHH